MHIKNKQDAEKIDEKKLLARKRDAERKRISRALKGTKKRSDMTPEELAHMRKLERIRQEKRRMNLSAQKKEEIMRKDREAKQRKREANREKANIKSLIYMRKHRLLQSEAKKSIVRCKARIGMRCCRKEGALKDYVERRKKHIWAVKWRKFLSQNPKLRELDRKKKKKQHTGF